MSSKSERVDNLIDHLWKYGYLTLSRKYGRYLPEPKPIGGYDVDAVAKYKKKIAIGLTLSAEELNDPNLVTKLNFLAAQHPKFSRNKVTLFLGVPTDSADKAKIIVSFLDQDLRNRIKIVTINK